MARLPEGFKRLGGTPEEMLTELSKRTGGIPAFAQQALKKAGVDPGTIEEADKAGRVKKD